MRLLKAFLTATLVSAAIIWSHDPRIRAQDLPNFVMEENSQSLAATLEYWTPERLANAEPLPLPEAVYDPGAAFEPEPTGVSESSDAGIPSVPAVPGQDQLYDPASGAIEPALGIEPTNVGTLGAHFSSSRLVPVSADLSWPYVTIGKLFFMDPANGRNFVCSASIIHRRIVATAGHCVHKGTGLDGVNRGFFTNWYFVPALRGATAPFGTWSWAFVIVTRTWVFGGGGVPNAADYAMFEMQDRAGTARDGRIGSLLGWLGWQTLSLSRNHAHMIGYPCNIDSCRLMHQVTAGSFANGGNNTVLYGSDMRGGSSGGPWVQNFGIPGIGQRGGLNPGIDRVIAVTSYGPTSTNPKYQGASILDGRWVQIWNIVCAHRVGNCA